MDPFSGKMSVDLTQSSRGAEDSDLLCSSAALRQIPCWRSPGTRAAIVRKPSADPYAPWSFILIGYAVFKNLKTFKCHLYRKSKLCLQRLFSFPAHGKGAAAFETLIAGEKKMILIARF